MQSRDDVNNSLVNELFISGSDPSLRRVPAVASQRLVGQLDELPLGLNPPHSLVLLPVVATLQNAVSI